MYINLVHMKVFIVHTFKVIYLSIDCFLSEAANDNYHVKSLAFHANIFLMSKMGSIVKFIGKLTKTHQKYTLGKIAILDKTNICMHRIGIQVSTVLRMRTVNLTPSF